MPTAPAMPPIAASTGTIERRRSRSSPRSNSRRASRPTTKKKNVIRPLFTHSRSVRSSPSPPTRIETTVPQSALVGRARRRSPRRAPRARRRAARPRRPSRCAGTAAAASACSAPTRCARSAAPPAGRVQGLGHAACLPAAAAGPVGYGRPRVSTTGVTPGCAAGSSPGAVSGVAARSQRYGETGVAAARVELEVEVRMQPVGVAGVADVPDQLAGLHLLAVGQARARRTCPRRTSRGCRCASSRRCSGGCRGRSCRSCRRGRACSRRSPSFVQKTTLPASTATTGALRSARMSLPSCTPCPRGSPKSSEYETLPTIGKMSTGTAPRADGWPSAGAANTVAASTIAAARVRRMLRAVSRCAVMAWERQGAKGGTLAEVSVGSHPTAAGSLVRGIRLETRDL